MNATDDAYNKRLKDPNKPGTLMGNWQQERVLRETTGEGRTIPQRHVRRSGLLKDFTKKPTDGFKVGDNTFERCYGHRVYDQEIPSSKEFGKFFVEGNRDHAAQQLAEARGPRLQGHIDYAREIAEEYVMEVDRIEEEKNVVKKTTTNQEMYPRAELPDPGGSLLDRSDVRPEVSYHRDVGISYWTEALRSEDPHVRANVSTSAMTGHNVFGKNSEYSVNVADFLGGAHKTHENNKMLESCTGRDPMALLSPDVSPRHSLVDFKKALHAKLVEKAGGSRFAIAMLRRDLLKKADSNGFVARKVYEELLHYEGISTRYLGFYLKNLSTNEDIKVYTFMESFRPSVSREKLEAIQDVLGDYAFVSREGSVCPEVMQIAKEMGLKNEEECATFWCDIASLVDTVEDLKVLFPKKVAVEESAAAGS